MNKPQPPPFVVVIPVADRPGHLHSCLASLQQQLRHYPYADNDRISVLIADDSLHSASLAAHAELAARFNAQGLRIEYFGQTQQYQLLQGLERSGLQGILGDLRPDRLGHKGASIMRNLCYLHLARRVRQQPDLLIWFIDSDQEFRVIGPAQNGQGQEQEQFLDYFNALAQLFQEPSIQVVTGKVVGDPPVSPAVMAANFIADAGAFLGQMGQLAADAPCSFHGQPGADTDDAAYHDMAELFGFSRPQEPFRYPCPLSGAHSHADCLRQFTQRLNRFFDGEHPTRRSYYRPQSVADSLTAARTVYTGNYLLRGQALRFFIPFAPLRLRMAGPLLGRLIRAELGPGFVSVNLPLLHRRTLEGLGRSEFRPGVARQHSAVDLSGEFERQFYGDVLLFAMEKLLQQGFLGQGPGPVPIRPCLDQTTAALLQRYQGMQQNSLRRLQRLSQLQAEPQAWWQGRQGLAQARQEIDRFIANCKANFGEQAPGYTRIKQVAAREGRLTQIEQAIANHAGDRAAWNKTLMDGTA
ncbi:MAG: hypothetical protein H7842_12725 [Gammaproteobacteria bacterium SHHR-1]|uniref:hypothetical protein n=1 Tax=Magnetovirga frankeli TaxID=947516 RepID=UPI00129321B2|nr:hypothetical protein D5125_02920 [gamma proteobacterium SS-5]